VRLLGWRIRRRDILELGEAEGDDIYALSPHRSKRTENSAPQAGPYESFVLRASIA